MNILGRIKRINVVSKVSDTEIDMGLYFSAKSKMN